jgi:Tripartite tricarboxylate transporter TctB family
MRPNKNFSVPRLDAKELAFGLFLIVLALVAFGATSSLAIGSAADMGPGFVPRALAWIILGFGVIFLVTGLLKVPEPLPALAWRPLVMILASIALFAVLFSTLGLIAACVGTVVVAGAATTPVRWLQLVAFGVAMAAFSALLFVKGLGLPFKLW